MRLMADSRFRVSVGMLSQMFCLMLQARAMLATIGESRTD